MSRTMSLLSLSATMPVFCLWSGGAQAQATRTWVSGVGDDANPCSRTAPCKTFAGAISKTAPGGEIDALDPGGFGAVTITKAITIDGGGGQVASVLVSGTNGINVAAGATDIVTLRNIQFQGLGPSGNAGLNGINYTSGLGLIVEHCNISGFAQNGINVATTGGSANMTVHDTYVTHNGNGIQLAPSAGSVAAGLRDVRAEGNTGTGFLLNPSGAGAAAALIDQSSALLNATGIGVHANSLLFLGNSEVVGNGAGVHIFGGTANSYKTNEINGNGTDVTGGSLTGILLQ
jgi:hypothetical protein